MRNSEKGFASRSLSRRSSLVDGGTVPASGRYGSCSRISAVAVVAVCCLLDGSDSTEGGHVVGFRTARGRARGHCREAMPQKYVAGWCVISKKTETLLQCCLYQQSRRRMAQYGGGRCTCSRHGQARYLEYHGLVPPSPSFLPNGEGRGGAERSLGGPLHLRGLAQVCPLASTCTKTKGASSVATPGRPGMRDCGRTDGCHGHDSHHAELTCGVDGV